jgi:hypothetical protein
MTVPRPHDGPTAPRDRDWTWSEQQAAKLEALRAKGGWRAVAGAHAWYDDAEGDPPERADAYKLPHHEVVGGQVRVVWRGVSHAMNILAGGRGGVSIPDGDKPAVWRHLARHYRQFGEEPPEVGGAGGLADLTRRELLDRARKAGIAGRSRMGKQELVEALRDA